MSPKLDLKKNVTQKIKTISTKIWKQYACFINITIVQNIFYVLDLQ